MAEFYVTFAWNGLDYVGFVTAPRQPETSHFASYEELHETMDELGHWWVMTYEMPHPHQFAFEEVAVWEKQLAEMKTLIPMAPLVGRARGLFE